jgi:hypothetical protein
LLVAVVVAGGSLPTWSNVFGACYLFIVVHGVSYMTASVFERLLCLRVAFPVTTPLKAFRFGCSDSPVTLVTVKQSLACLVRADSAAHPSVGDVPTRSCPFRGRSGHLVDDRTGSSDATSSEKPRKVRAVGASPWAHLALRLSRCASTEDACMSLGIAAASGTGSIAGAPAAGPAADATFRPDTASRRDLGETRRTL